MVLLQESKRNVCEHALQSTKPCPTVGIHTVIRVAGVLPSAPESAGQREKNRKQLNTHLPLLPPFLIDHFSPRCHQLLSYFQFTMI